MTSFLDHLAVKIPWALAMSPWGGLGLALFILALRTRRRGWRSCWAPGLRAARMGVLMGSFQSARGAFLRQALGRRLILLLKAPGSLLLFCRPIRRCAIAMGLGCAALLALAVFLPLASPVHRLALLPLSAAYRGQAPCDSVHSAALGPGSKSSATLSIALLSFAANDRWAMPDPSRRPTHLALGSPTLDLATTHARAHQALSRGLLGRRLAEDLSLASNVVFSERASALALRDSCGFDPDAFLLAASQASFVPWSSSRAWLSYLNPRSGAFGDVDRAAADGFGPEAPSLAPGAWRAAHVEAAAWTHRHGPGALEDLLANLRWMGGLCSMYLLLMGAGEIFAFCRGFSMASHEREQALFERARLDDELRSETLPPPAAPTRRL